MRLGFFLGFLIGAAAASVITAEEQPESGETAPGATAETGLLGGVRGHVREALQAAREAAQEKEREMQRSFEQATSRRN